MSENSRIYYIDWLRIIVVALLIPHHAAITFSHLGDAYVYLPIKDSSLYFFIQSNFLNLWFMRMLFFISGISTFYALRKRTHKEYFIERCKKLLTPTVFALLLVCPPMGYFKAITMYGFDGSLIAFYPMFFSNIVTYLGWGHLWFLVYLFVFSMIFLTIRMRYERLDAICETIGAFLSRGSHILIPMALIVFLEMLFRPFYPGFQTLIHDWANFSVYLSFFIGGYIVASYPKCIDAIVTHLRTFSIVGIIATVSYIVSQPGADYADELWLSFLQGIAGYSLVLLFFGLAKRHLNRTNRAHNYLSKTSFSLYVFHFLILNLVVYHTIQLPWDPFAIYVISIVLVYGLFFIAYELFIKHVPPLRYILGITK